jgi:hypothetical protein
MTTLKFYPNPSPTGRVCVTHENMTLCKGDIVCFGEPFPDFATGSNYNGEFGFIVDSSAGESLYTLPLMIEMVLGMADRSLSLWRFQHYAKGTPKRAYVPSNWASPVPLP